MDSIGSAEGSAGRLTRFNHILGGCNVLYLDGHVGFIKFPGEYHVTRYVAFYSVGRGKRPADLL